MSVAHKVLSPDISRRDVLSGLAVGAVALTTGSFAKAGCTTTPSSGPIPIYVYSPNSVSASVMAAYNAKRNDCVYQPYLTRRH